jgi:hypothetical protein
MLNTEFHEPTGADASKTFFEIIVPALDPLKLAVVAILDERGLVENLQVLDSNFRHAGSQREIEPDDHKFEVLSDRVGRVVKNFLKRYTSVARTYDESWRAVVDKLTSAINCDLLNGANELDDCRKIEVEGKEDADQCKISTNKISAHSVVLAVTRLPLNAETLDVMIEVFDFTSPSAFKRVPEILRVDRVAATKRIEVAKLKSSRWHRLSVRAGDSGKWSEAVEVTTFKIKSAFVFCVLNCNAAAGRHKHHKYQWSQCLK